MSEVLFSDNPEFFMRRAIELAKGGEGWTNPNPLVGAVIVKDGTIIGEGFHHKYGDLHAERDALKNCRERGNNPDGASIYVTLEPCCHYGKQPPCTEALVEAGIKQVFVGSRDPNPLVHGKGNAFLREHGVSVTEDFLKDECDALNPVFFHYITTKIPYVALKYAMTMDGKIATKTGASKWITGEESRRYVHQLRNRYAAILCGIGTVLADNPLLDCRIENGNNPVRIICDSSLRIPIDCNIVKTSKAIPTFIACCKFEGNESLYENLFEKRDKARLLREAGIGIIETDSSDGHVNLVQLMNILGEKKIDSVLIEGGAEINYSALESGIVNRIYTFVAPKIFGGTGKSPVSGTGISLPEESFNFRFTNIRQFGDDILMEFTKK